MPELFRLNYDAICQVWSYWAYPLPYYSVFAADTLLYAVTLTSDLEYLQCIACDVMKLCTKFERNRAIRGGVLCKDLRRDEIRGWWWWFDLEHVLYFALASGIIFTKFDLLQLTRSWIIAFLMLIRWHAVTLTQRLTLKVCGTSSVTWSKSVRNFSEIEQSPAELLITLRIFVHVVTLWSWPRA